TETSETLATRMDQERENVIRHQPPCESAYDIKMRRYYYYREERGMGKTYGYGGPPPESPDDADLKEMYEAELNRSHERLDESKTVTNIKWAFHVLFGG
ncbi:MAG TPA: hypothetical protein PKH31_06120, partial [Candidatus Sumerlaeota bacterium]|nr:hypothetical protein [Candidatus Sumerlaeota bacterium]